MKKDAFYFPHDSNAKDDPKITLLIDQLGLEGYGIFWVLIEILRDQPDYKYPLKLLPSIARKYATTFEKVKAVVYIYELFSIENEDFFYSKSLIERMIPLEKSREQRKLAVKSRWDKNKQKETKTDTTVIRPYNESNTVVIQSRVEESRVEESRVEESRVEESRKEEKIENFTPEIINNNFLENKKEILNSERWIEETTMHLRLKATSTVKSLLENFFEEQKLKGNDNQPINEYKSHFINWAKIEIEKQKNKKEPEFNMKKINDIWK